MNSQATSSFWSRFRRLPPEIQELAVKQYHLWLRDPRYPSLHFKKVLQYWSARITDDYRVLGTMDEDTVIWFWVGTHAEYDRLLNQE